MIFCEIEKRMYLCSMKQIDWLFLIAVVAVVVTIFLLAWHWLKRRNDYARLCERVHQHTDRYIFLIDRKFRVRETNFYEHQLRYLSYPYDYQECVQNEARL